ncbi:protocadherin wing polarity protein stan, partial [Biomphalaria glabrata]
MQSDEVIDLNSRSTSTTCLYARLSPRQKAITGLSETNSKGPCLNCSSISLVFLLLWNISPTHSYEIHHPVEDSGGTSLYLNATMPSDNWHYSWKIPDLDLSKNIKSVLPLDIIHSSHYGVYTLHRKVDCNRLNHNPVQLNVKSVKSEFHVNNFTVKAAVVVPYYVFLSGHDCQVFHKEWQRERLHGQNGQVAVTLLIPSASHLNTCFKKGRTVTSLYSFIPLQYHACKVQVVSLSQDIFISDPSLFFSFGQDRCLDRQIKAKFLVTAICSDTRHIVPYTITLKEVQHISMFSPSQRKSLPQIVSHQTNAAEKFHHREASHSHDLPQRFPRRVKRQVKNRPPTFPQAQYNTHVKEEQDPGLSVIVITATDQDEGEAGMLVYRMEAYQDLRSSDMFAINPQTGLVNTTKKLDRETMTSHVFLVYATDRALPESERRSASVLLTILVDDVNDHTPTFPATNARIEVPENGEPVREVYKAQAVDGDSGNNAVIRYSILNAGQPNDIFSIETQSGSISTRSSLDREKVSSYKLIIQAMDQCDILNDRRSSTFTLSINVLDENDNSPQFTQDSYVVNLREDQQVSLTKEILNVTAIDADDGLNAQISYRLAGQSQDKFSIDKYTGKLFLIGQLDYEDTPSYQLVVWAEDQGTPSRRNSTSVFVRVIDVNDNSPMFNEMSYSASIDENVVIGTSVVQVQAEDKDSGNNGLVVYSVLNPPKLFPFQIDSETGWIKTSGQVDRETQSMYTFVVKAQDKGDPPLSATTTVVITLKDVNDNSPVFQRRMYNASISEEALKGEQVIRVLATDADEGDNARVTYTIDRGNDKDSFQIKQTQGEGIISVNKKLDARDQNKYILTISATDKDGKSDTVLVYIDILDTNRFAPEFQTNTGYSFEVSEDVDIGTSVFSVVAIDRDRGENARITYSLQGSSVFTIDPDTGVIKVQQKLDRETVPAYMLTAIATDNGKPPLNDIAEIAVTVKDVNDNKPEFQKNKYFGKVSEDALVGTKILNVTAIDKDDGVYGQVKYTFDGGNDGNGAFSIDNQGWIRLAKLVDRETIAAYDLVVVAVDSDPIKPQSSSVVVHIDVDDVNDNAPVFEASTFTVKIDENSPIGSTVAVIKADDPDEGVNALVVYSIASGADSDSFELAGRPGDPAIIVTRINLDYESNKQSYEIVLRAASGTLISTAKIIIQVQDVNDNPPVLEDFSIIYNNFGGSFPIGPIGKIPAFDPDVSDRDKLIYKILSGNKADLLYLNESSGEVTLDPRLNSDVPRTGVFQMSVSDGVSEVKATCRLWVRLVTLDMLHSAVTIRLNKMTQTAFLSPLLKFFVDGLASILGTDESNIFVINIEDDTDVSAQILNVSVSVRKGIDTAQGQTVDLFHTPEYIREVIYLHRSLLANLSTSQVLPFDDNLCLVEPCTNFEICRSLVNSGEARQFISSRTVLFRPVHPTQIFSCVCPSGFAGMNQTKMCDTEIDLCYSLPCQHNGVCLRHENGYTCQCKTGFTGANCEYNMTSIYDSLTCPSDQCKGTSHCVPLSSGGFTCADCPQDGYHDMQCQLRTKSFKKGSYLTFASLKSRNRFTIQMRFATQEKDGLLVYNGRFNGEHDFIALEIVNSQIKFSFCLGSNETTSVTTNIKGGVSNGEWTTVKVEYVTRVATISVGENCDPEIAINFQDKLGPYSCAVRVKQTLADVCNNPIKECNRLLDLTGPLQVGGMPVMPSSGQVDNQDFIGCISDLYIDHKLVDLDSPIADHSTSLGCPPKELMCQSAPCKNG